MKVALFNIKYSPNLGDGLLSECLEAALEDSGRQITVHSIDLAGRTAFSSGNALRGPILSMIQRLPMMVRSPLTYLMLSTLVRYRLRQMYAGQLSDADAVVLGGGNLIADSDLNFPIKIAGALREAGRRDLPVAVFGVGVSDRWSRIGKAVIRHAFATAKLIDVTVRDRRSQSVWDCLLASDEIPGAGLVRDPGLLAAARYGVAAPTRGGSIGLCLTHPVLLRYHAIDDQVYGDIESWFCLFAQALVIAGHRVVLFTNGSPEDRRLRDTIGPRLVAESDGAIGCAPDFATPGDLVHFIASCSLVVAHRMHACIAAHAVGVRTIGLSWDPKLDSFFALAGLEDFMATPNRIPLDAVVALVERALREPPDEAARTTLIAQSRADVDQLAALLVDAVESRA